MSCLDWSDHDWRAKFFNRPARRLPLGYQSHAKQEWDDALARAEERVQGDRRDWAAHARQLAEQEQIERWTPLVETYGSAVVEAICQRTDVAFRLPASLRGKPPASQAEEEE